MPSIFTFQVHDAGKRHNLSNVTRVWKERRDVPSLRLSDGGRIRRESKRAADEPPGIENMAALVCHPVAVVLVREDDLRALELGTKDKGGVQQQIIRTQVGRG